MEISRHRSINAASRVSRWPSTRRAGHFSEYPSFWLLPASCQAQHTKLRGHHPPSCNDYPEFLFLFLFLSQLFVSPDKIASRGNSAHRGVRSHLVYCRDNCASSNNHTAIHTTIHNAAKASDPGVCEAVPDYSRVCCDPFRLPISYPVVILPSKQVVRDRDRQRKRYASSLTDHGHTENSSVSQTAPSLCQPSSRSSPLPPNQPRR